MAKQSKTFDRVKEVLQKRKEEGKNGSEDGDKQKTWGRVPVIFYREGAYRTDKDGEQISIGGDQNGNYDRICKALNLPDNDPAILADALEVLAEDIASGKLIYKE